ncbi:MAG: mechanosensitive ion channel [Gammaproteobacteria bacterium]|nr:mechanosensitive ion channel [Gammaproteobacteria bacterium]
MQELLEALPSNETIRDFLNSPSTWAQFGIFLAGLLVAKLAGSWLQHRLRTMAQPGTIEGVGRIAMRTGALGLIPLLLWLWLLAAIAFLRHHGWDTGLLRPAMILAGALAVIRMGVFVLRHSFSPGGPLKAWEGALTVTIWTLVALHILGWQPWVEQMLDEYALTFGAVRVSLLNVLSFFLSIAVMLLVALWLANAIRGRVAQSRALDESMKLALSKLVKFVLLTLAVLAAMVSAGIDITAFAVFGGALGVGLGLGMQRVVSNFVSGFILAFEGSIRPGDVISYRDTYGTVKALHTRHIVIRTRDGMDILVPNENLMTSDIASWSYEGDRRIRLRLPLQISYKDDPEQALARLERIARSHDRVLKDPASSAVLTGFGDNGVNLELLVWIDDPEHGGDVRSDLFRQIWKDFKTAGITLPCPQREVYLRESPGPAISPADAKSDSRAESARGRKREGTAKPPG